MEYTKQTFMKQLMENYKAKYPCSRMINRKKKSWFWIRRLEFEKQLLCLSRRKVIWVSKNGFPYLQNRNFKNIWFIYLTALLREANEIIYIEMPCMQKQNKGKYFSKEKYRKWSQINLSSIHKPCTVLSEHQHMNLQNKY